MLVGVMLTGDELDKFKVIKHFPDMCVLTTFYRDEAIDSALYS